MANFKVNDSWIDLRWSYKGRSEKDTYREALRASDEDFRKMVFYETILMVKILGADRWLTSYGTHLRDMTPGSDVSVADGITEDGQLIIHDHWAEHERDKDKEEPDYENKLYKTAPVRSFYTTVLVGCLQEFQLQISSVFDEPWFALLLFLTKGVTDERFEELKVKYPELWAESLMAKRKIVDEEGEEDLSETEEEET